MNNSLPKSKNLHFRDLKLEDLEQINEIYEKHFSSDFWLPNLKHTIGNGVIAGNDGKITAFGMVRLYPEAIIIIDRDQSLRDRCEALKILFEEAKKACSNKRFTELVAYTPDSNYAQLLAKHFKFEVLKGQKLQVNLKE